ncbi:MAG: cyclic nucleotide-binding domain-containing protein [Alphaproteobacteria bacterium]|nr:cyclic nucleotide-binding domain-containing protein [Alphaproteobacteria bacterium]
MPPSSAKPVEHYQAGDSILVKGDDADKAYMVEKGAVRVYLNNDGKIVELARLGPGEIFGETALFEGGIYGANIDAAEDTVLNVITPGWLDGAIEDVDPMVAALIRMLISRLKSTNEALVKSETREFIDVAFV